MRVERRSGPRAAFLAAMLSLGALACENVGSDRTIGVQATGVVRGVVYFDLNGSGTADAADQGFQGVRVRLRARGTTDTTGEGLTDAQGAFRVAGLPVGGYDVLVDTTLFGDSVSVVILDSTRVTVPPGDSVLVQAGVSFPRVSLGEARALPAGRKVFVEGIALTSFDNFGDTTVHVADTAASIRATRVLRTTVFPGDSVRVLAIGASRDGQPTLGNASLIVLGIGTVPPIQNVTTAAADSADGGRLDAGLVRIVDAVVQDSATVLSDYHLTVDDGSGLLTVIFEQAAGLTQTPYVPGVTVDVIGILVPTVTPGTWVLKPRQNIDVVLK